MVKITNGVVTFEVTRGAYDGIYSHQGFKPVEEVEEVAEEKVATGEDVDNRTDDEKFADELAEKPISQWNKEEVKRFAAIKEIDISGTKNANEAKEIIKSFIDGE